MTEYTTTDIVTAALAGEGSIVKDAAKYMLAQKVNDSLDVKRTEIARNFIVPNADQGDTDDGA